MTRPCQVSRTNIVPPSLRNLMTSIRLGPVLHFCGSLTSILPSSADPYRAPCHAASHQSLVLNVFDAEPSPSKLRQFKTINPAFLFPSHRLFHHLYLWYWVYASVLRCRRYPSCSRSKSLQRIFPLQAHQCPCLSFQHWPS